MDVNLELIKRIISSDELCDKVNSGDNKDIYIKQIHDYVLTLIDDSINTNSNIVYVNRYLKKFVLDKSKEDIFFDRILLKCYSYNVKNSEFLSILDNFNFDGVKEILIKKYNEYIINKTSVSMDTLIRMLSLYCYTCPKYVFDSSYINYFTYYLYSMDIVLDYDLLSYFYKEFALCFAESKGISTSFVVLDNVVSNDPYYDNVRNKIFLYNSSIGSKVDPFILSDIFYQITYLYILKGINEVENKVYTYEQLELVKEICLISIMGSDYYDVHYGDISYSSFLKKQSLDIVSNYFSSLGLKIVLEKNVIDSISIDKEIDDKTDKAISVDVLFDQVLKNENPNLISSLVRSYPILGSEYKNSKKKSLLGLIMDIYDNKKLLINLNKDLGWYKNKNDDELIVKSKIEKLNNKITVCTSYIGVMNSIIMNGDLTSYDLLRSISDLITYSHSNKMIKNDIYLVLSEVIPKKIKRLCFERNEIYREELKRKIIKCYLDSLELIKNQISVDYFMKLYSTLDLCISAFDVD
jgi:hypothetical protein